MPVAGTFALQMSSRLLPLLVLLSVLAGCAPAASQPTTEVNDRGLLLSRLRAAVADVATAQDVADQDLTTALGAVRAIDEAVAGLQDVDTLEDEIDAWDEQDTTFGAASVDDLRSELIDVAVAVDEARGRLATARSRLDDPWETEYLAAEDAVLAAVRDYAETSDRLAQLLQRHWPVYQGVRDEVASFVERRWYFRSTQEAADAFTVEMDPLRPDLQAAQRQIAEYRTRRADAAEVVNGATADAVSVWDRRSADQPTGTGS
jgi:hypothetical protein